MFGFEQIESLESLNEEKEISIPKFQILDIVLSAVTLLIAIISLSSSILTLIIHIKKRSYRKGFFTVILTIVILELIFNVEIFIDSICFLIFHIINKESNFKVFQKILSCIFYLSFYLLISYNVMIVGYLYKTSRIQNDQNDIRSSISSTESEFHVHIEISSFKCMHILSFIISIIITVLIFSFSKDGNYFDVCNFLKFSSYKDMNSNDNLKICFFTIPQLLYILIVIMYLIFYFCYKNRRETHNMAIFTKTNSYNIFIFVNSLCNLFMIFGIFIFLILDKKKDLTEKNRLKTCYYICKVVGNLGIIGFMINNTHYRFNCYYIQSVLGKDSESLCTKIKNGFLIVGGKLKIEDSNINVIVDYSSNYVLHSLLTLKDITTNLADGSDVQSMELFNNIGGYEYKSREELKIDDKDKEKDKEIIDHIEKEIIEEKEKEQEKEKENENNVDSEMEDKKEDLIDLDKDENIANLLKDHDFIKENFI